MTSPALAASAEKAAHQSSLPPAAYVIVAFSALVALLFATRAFRSVGSRR